MSDLSDIPPSTEAPSTAGGEAFVCNFVACQWRIYGFISSLVPKPSDADDIFQETTLVLWRRFNSFKPGTSFMAWALQIARHKVLRYWEQQKAARRFRSEGLEALIDDLAQIAAGEEAQFSTLERCLDKLPERSREIVRLRYSLGASTESVAKQLGRTPSAIYKALNRIHELLRDCIKVPLEQERKAGGA